MGARDAAPAAATPEAVLAFGRQILASQPFSQLLGAELTQLTAEGACELRLPLRPVSPQMILLVEDDDSLREMLRHMLTTMGHSVIEAASLVEAQGLTDLPGLTLILSDMQLGDGLGHALARTGLPPLLLMTALPPGDPLRAIALCPVLSKPFDSATLAQAISEVLDD